MRRRIGFKTEGVTEDVDRSTPLTAIERVSSHAATYFDVRGGWFGFYCRLSTLIVHNDFGSSDERAVCLHHRRDE